MLSKIKNRTELQMVRFEVLCVFVCFQLFSKFSTFALDFYILCGQFTLMCVEAITSKAYYYGISNKNLKWTVTKTHLPKNRMKQSPMRFPNEKISGAIE